MRFFDLSTNPDLDPTDPENYDQLTLDCEDCEQDIIDTWPEDDWAL
jgi:hypothetical protein